MRDLSNWSVERLEKRFAHLQCIGGETLREQCEILVALASRKSVVKYISEGYLRFYREIADGRLDAEAAIMVGGGRVMLTALLGLPPERQRAIAAGEPVDTVEHTDEGKIVRVSKPVRRMAAREIKTAFCDTGVRPIAEQRRILEKAPKDVRRSSVAVEGRYDSETEEVVCGRMRIPMASLATWTKGYWKITRDK